MRHLAGLMAGLAVSAAATAVAAQGQPERMFQLVPQTGACAAPLAETGKPITFRTPLASDQAGALYSAIFLAFHDPAGADTWPGPQVKAAPPCPLARFTAEDLVWTISGGQEPAPVRWAHTAGRDEGFFLVKGPALANAEAWHRGGRRGLPSATGAPTYFLATRIRDMNFIVRMYDGPPSARQLADDLADFEEDKPGAGLIGVHDPVGDAISLFVKTESAIQAEIFRPQDITGGAIAGLFVPDGKLFMYEDGAYVLRGSGFTCPQTYGTYERDIVGISNPNDVGLDLVCYFKSEDGFLTLFVTRAPDASGDKPRWTNTFRAQEQETGVSTKLDNPPQGPKAAIQAGRNWVDKDGVVQTILFMRRGEYLYEVRQSHTPESIEAASKALLAVIEQLSLPSAQTADGWRARR